MAGHYSDNDDANNEPVQDYLDLLLTHATEKPETQIDVAEQESEPVSQPQHAPLTRPAEQLSTNNIALFSARAGTRIAARTVSPGVTPSAPSPVPSQPALQPQSRPALKPFAEPVRPMPLKPPVMPSLKKAEPQAKTETPVRTQTQVQAPPQIIEPEVKPPAAKTRILSTPESKTPPVVKAPPAVEPPPPVQKPIAAPPVEQAPEVPPELEQTREKTFTTTEWLNGRPNWAQGRFECLLFSVGGLTLAVPLVELGTIYPMGDELTPIFGQAEWFMGLLSVKDGNLKTIDTAKVVMPERYQATMPDNYAYVISINGMPWGLAVDSVANAILLEPSDIKWRSERSKRPWLAGTVVEHMCALVDVSQLAAMFETARFESAGKRKPNPPDPK